MLDSGHDVTNVTPVFEGFSIREAIKTALYGGNAITLELMKIYETQNSNMRGNRAACTKIKENECSVKDKAGGVKVQSSQVFNLPDGQTLNLGAELQDVPE